MTGIPLLLGWTASAQAAWLQSARAAGVAWLAALNVPVRIDGVPLSLLPVGWGLVTVLLLVACGRWLSARVMPEHAGEVVATAAWGAVPLAAGAVALAFAVSDDSVVISPARAGVQVFVIALVTLSLSIGRGGGVLLSDLIAPTARTVVRILISGGVAATAVLAMLAMALTTAALILRFNAVTAAMSTLTADPGATPLVLVLCLGYLPAAGGWTLATMLGLGQPVPLMLEGVPALPIIVGQPLPLPSWAWAVCGVAAGLLAGAVAGRIALRRSLVEPAWTSRILLAVGIGVVGAACVGIVITCAGGSLGVDALASVGPSPWPAAATALWLIVIGVLLGMIRPAMRDEGEQDRMRW